MYSICNGENHLSNYLFDKYTYKSVEIVPTDNENEYFIVWYDSNTHFLLDKYKFVHKNVTFDTFYKDKLIKFKDIDFTNQEMVSNIRIIDNGSIKKCIESITLSRKIKDTNNNVGQREFAKTYNLQFAQFCNNIANVKALILDTSRLYTTRAITSNCKNSKIYIANHNKEESNCIQRKIVTGNMSNCTVDFITIEKVICNFAKTNKKINCVFLDNGETINRQVDFLMNLLEYNILENESVIGFISSIERISETFDYQYECMPYRIIKCCKKFGYSVGYNDCDFTYLKKSDVVRGNYRTLFHAYKIIKIC